MDEQDLMGPQPWDLPEKWIRRSLRRGGPPIADLLAPVMQLRRIRVGFIHSVHQSISNLVTMLRVVTPVGTLRVPRSS